MKRPAFIFPEKFRAELTDRDERSFFVRRHIYRCRRDEGFALIDSNGDLWRPHAREWDSDGASIPHPLDWIIPALDSLRYKRSAMGIHDPAYRFGRLDKWNDENARWDTVVVPRDLADWLLAQGIEAEGGWKLTQKTYWLGVRVPNWIAGLFR